METFEMNRRNVKKTGTAGVAAGRWRVLGKATLWMGLILIMALPSAVSAIQPDAEYLVREKQFGEQWVADRHALEDRSFLL